ncbi:MAG: 50S ribosomal protein L6 [Methanosarcinales archaeon]|nr:MAG: 50S ribosomal protein L6 [Methanosarcinales archaeon]
MMKESKKIIPIPEGVNVEVDGSVIKATGPKGELQRELVFPGISIEKKGNEVVVSTNIARRRERAMVGTFTSHVRNVMVGVTEGFERKLRIIYSHFPIQVKVTGDIVSISNFLGERKPRKAKMLGNSNVQVSGDEVIVTGTDKEMVCQTAANIEQATRIKRFDPRVFQDGIYVVEE